MFCENVVLNDTGWLFGEKTVWTGEEQLVSNIIQWIVVRCGTLLHDFVNGLVNTLLNDKEVLKYIMGEVMICRGGRGGGNSHAGLEKVLTTLFFNTNDTWTVPDGIVNNEISVRIFGGGGSGSGHNGSNSEISGIAGGSGWMNNDVLKVGAGEQISITIGAGGKNNSSGGTSSFGSYLTAFGGSPKGHGGAGGGGSSTGTASGGIGYQFGGGGSSSHGGSGGNGGPWGGGGGGGGGNNYRGGAGGIYGGGGGGYAYLNWEYLNGYTMFCYGGNGGKYGGGGCSFGDMELPNATFNNVSNIVESGIGGEYGGNGAIYSIWYDSSWYRRLIKQSTNGTNTIGNEIYGGEYNENFEGAGEFGINGGGGGYGGNGGMNKGGGGGYGSNGGAGILSTFTTLPGGGGGGYGGDGGYAFLGGGGGGGYGKNSRGGNGCNFESHYSSAYGGGGGGGYYAAAYDVPYGNNKAATGGAGTIVDGVKYAYGGNTNKPGLGGVCIVQFYRWL